MNNKYIIKIKHPLLRAGLTIETEASEKYVVAVTNKLLDLIREINKPEQAGDNQTVRVVNINDSKTL